MPGTKDNIIRKAWYRSIPPPPLYTHIALLTIQRIILFRHNNHRYPPLCPYQVCMLLFLYTRYLYYSGYILWRQQQRFDMKTATTTEGLPKTSARTIRYICIGKRVSICVADGNRSRSAPIDTVHRQLTRPFHHNAIKYLVVATAIMLVLYQLRSVCCIRNQPHRPSKYIVISTWYVYTYQV